MTQLTSIAFITPNSAINTNQILADATGGKVYTLQEDRNEMAYQEILNRPAAELALEEYFGVVGEEFYFDASGSRLLNNTKSNYDTQSPTLYYDWDLDADGIFEIENSTYSITKIYDRPTEGFIQVRVTDSAGHISNMSARLQVVESLPASAQIQNLSATEVAVNSYQVNFEAQDTESILVVLDDAIYGFLDARIEQNLIIHDVENVTTVSLIPYNSFGSRGEAKSIQIGKTRTRTRMSRLVTLRKNYQSPRQQCGSSVPSSPNKHPSQTARPDLPKPQ